MRAVLRRRESDQTPKSGPSTIMNTHKHKTQSIQRGHGVWLAFTVASASLINILGGLGNNGMSPPGVVEARCESPRAVETGVHGGVGSLRICLIGE